MSKESEQKSVDLTEALKQMNEQGTPPTGFHMMLLSPDFGLKEDCPTLQLLKMLGQQYDFSDTIKRQVFQLPQNNIISYEFAWLGGFETIQDTMESVDKIIGEQMKRFVDDGTLKSTPQARISFLAPMPDEGGEEE